MSDFRPVRHFVSRDSNAVLSELDIDHAAQGTAVVPAWPYARALRESLQRVDLSVALRDERRRLRELLQAFLAAERVTRMPATHFPDVGAIDEAYDALKEARHQLEAAACPTILSMLLAALDAVDPLP